ncbi:hypothetical protein [Haloferax volcanii]|uniref:hypothetical protein n=1 Tax=Haloferax volcanii TaxID=2246 RepID=UPI00385321C5
MVKVDIFGTYHLDCPKKVEEELRAFSSEADVFFTEAPREEPDKSDWNSLRLRNPTVWVAGKFLNSFWQAGGYLLTRQRDSVDTAVTKKIARERGLQMTPVDETIVRSASDVNPLLTVFSWMWVALTLSVLAFGITLWPKALLVYGVPLPSGFFVSLSVAMGFIPIIPLAYLTLGERNGVIADNIEEFLKGKGKPERGCLIVGHKHIDGVVEDLEESAVDVGETHRPKFLRRSL